MKAGMTTEGNVMGDHRERCMEDDLYGDRMLVWCRGGRVFLLSSLFARVRIGGLSP